MISGMEDDLHRNRFDTFEDLYEYCYKVASTVGLVCIEIYGYDSPEAKDEAEAWGIYMQLINILRDVLEDSKRGRIYLPLDDLIRFGITEEDVLGERTLSSIPDGSHSATTTLKGPRHMEELPRACWVD